MAELQILVSLYKRFKNHNVEENYNAINTVFEHARINFQHMF